MNTALILGLMLAVVITTNFATFFVSKNLYGIKNYPINYSCFRCSSKNFKECFDEFTITYEEAIKKLGGNNLLIPIDDTPGVYYYNLTTHNFSFMKCLGDQKELMDLEL